MVGNAEFNAVSSGIEKPGFGKTRRSCEPQRGPGAHIQSKPRGRWIGFSAYLPYGLITPTRVASPESTPLNQNGGPRSLEEATHASRLFPCAANSYWVRR